jgi:hypothetical protein
VVQSSFEIVPLIQDLCTSDLDQRSGTEMLSTRFRNDVEGSAIGSIGLPQHALDGVQAGEKASSRHGVDDGTGGRA